MMINMQTKKEPAGFLDGPRRDTGCWFRFKVSGLTVNLCRRDPPQFFRALVGMAGRAKNRFGHGRNGFVWD